MPTLGSTICRLTLGCKALACQHLAVGDFACQRLPVGAFICQPLPAGSFWMSTLGYHSLGYSKFFILTLSQTTKLRLFQTERVCIRQFKIWWKWQKVLKICRKHCGKRRNCSLQAISPFPRVFKRGVVLQTRKNQGLFVKGLTIGSNPCLLDAFACQPLVAERFACLHLAAGAFKC